MLVIHGGPGILSMPQVGRDLSSKRPIYFYDQLGCGKSEKAQDKTYYAVDNYVDEMAAMRRHIPYIHLL